MKKLLIVNVLVILCISIITYVIYIWILKSTQSIILQNQIVLAFIVNTVLAIGIMSMLFVFRKKFKDQLGFVFMIGSFIKFAFFFVFFYPTYHADGVITRHEFLTFFIPYIICLVAETVTSIRLLNRLDTIE